MQFDGYKTAATTYLTSFYNDFANQFIDRSASSHALIWNDERANVNRYIVGLLNDIGYDVRDRWEEKFGYEKGDKLYEQFTKYRLPKEMKLFQFEAYSQPVAETSTGRVSSVTNSTRERNSYVERRTDPVRVTYSSSRTQGSTELQRIWIGAGGGGVVGSLIGYTIGKSFLAVTGGVAIGGVIGGLLILALTSPKRPAERRYVTLPSSVNRQQSVGMRPTQEPRMNDYEPKSPPELQPVSSSNRVSTHAGLILARQQEAEVFIHGLINQLETNYKTIEKENYTDAGERR